MNDLMNQLDKLLKPVNDAVHNSVPPAQLIRYTALYCLITAIANFCISIGSVTVGLFGGAAAAITAAGTAGTVEGQQAAAALGAVSGLALISGVLYVIAVPFLLIVAFGLYRRMGWARIGAVAVLGVTAIVALLRLFSGDIFNILWLLADLYLAYFFYTDSGIKHEFGQA